MLRNLFQYYLRQPETLPTLLSAELERRYPGEKVCTYALCDLDSAQHFSEQWVIIAGKLLVTATPLTGRDTWDFRSFALTEIDSFELFDGLSSSSLQIVGEKKRLLASLHFTRRQSRALSNVQFVAEQKKKQLKDSSVSRDLADGLDPDDEYREAMLKAIEDAKSMLSMPKMGVMLRLLSYLRPHKIPVICAFGTAALLTLVLLLPPYLMRVLVDDIIRPAEQGKVDNPYRMLWLVIGALALVYAIGEFMGFIRMRVMSVVGEKICMRLREDLYRHMQKLSLSFFSSRPTGTLIARVSSDTDRLWDFITFGVIDIGMAILQIIGVAVALFFQDVSLALLVLIPLPIMAMMFYFHSIRIQVHFLRMWRKWSAMTAVLSDVIPGIRVVKAFAQEEKEVERFSEKNRAVEAEAQILHRNWTRFWPTVVMLMHTCTLIVWIVGAPRVVRYITTNGEEGMPLGVFLAFTGYMWMFWAPVQQLGMMSRVINRVTTSASRVFEVLDTTPSIVSKENAVPPPPFAGDVRFENVSFSYDGARNVLKGVNFEVKAGEMIGLVGPSGSGKTTLVNLLCRFYDVKGGRILLDGVDVRDMELSGLRRQIGVVLQEPYLFHGSIAENIAYGSHGISPRDIIEAARAANAHEFICGFRDGYETIVGERGQTLSGGERQRISIARAILHNPRILVLDEATSSVDTETERKIQEALRRLVAGRTTFAIAHRLSTLSAAKRLFVLEDGKLVEQGTHAELLEKPDGVYAKLHRTQVELQANVVV
ncbi:MAG: hypothetical protein A2X49_16715 [Lentisphaerae bacterium GWF2_52_8]|nr:MAG: hypothetical protein A2X49_16715 [Lentisphaerae bacterium GWF2_52_8]